MPLTTIDQVIDSAMWTLDHPLFPPDWSVDELMKWAVLRSLQNEIENTITILEHSQENALELMKTRLKALKTEEGLFYERVVAKHKEGKNGRT